MAANTGNFVNTHNFRQEIQSNSIKTNQALSRCDNINIARFRKKLHSVKSKKIFQSTKRLDDSC